MEACVSTSILSRISESSCSSIESSSVLSSSLEEKDNDEDDGEDDDDDMIELFLEIIEESISDNNEEDDECNIQSTNADSPSKSQLIDVWRFHCSSLVLHLQRDILRVVAGNFCCSHTLEIIIIGTP